METQQEETPAKRKIVQSKECLGDDENYKGFTVEKAARIIVLDGRTCPDVDRWEEMPSLEGYPDLETLDLYKSRYITKVHESITSLQNLRHLSLTRCSRLLEIPASIGRLQNLQVVRSNKLVLAQS